MARKKEKAAVQWVPAEGGRLVKSYGGEEDGSSRERVSIALDDAGVRKIGDECKVLLAGIAEKLREVSTLKQSLSEMKRREAHLTGAMIERTLEEWRECWLFADDDNDIVRMYDVNTHELLGERTINWDERQEEMDLDDDQESDHDEEDEGHA